MILCPHCSQSNLEGALICTKCGRSLTSKEGEPGMTRKLDNAANELVARATWGTARFGEDATVILRIRGTTEPIVLKPAKRWTIGRVDTSSDQQPDVDLTPYDAFDKGVSRIHAAITRHERSLMLVDMSSANGTHLNGQRLIANEPRLLRDGDEIRLGKLVAHIYFR